MHPQIRKSEPGQCPICGMDLIPVSPSQVGAAANPDQVVLSERARALIELRTTPVRRRADASAQLRLLGRVQPNETTLKTVTAWTGGRIDELQVNTTGERVRPGQVIATLYSPEVYAAHQDLLVAKRQVARLSGGAEASRQSALATLEASRERLRLLGVPDEALARMEDASRPTRAVPIRTPFGGTVIERLATEGAYVSTGSPLYRIANLRTLWVQLDAYESDLANLSLGRPVLVEVDALPGEEFTGKITFIDPTLDAERRTAQVRVEVDNRDGRLRPGMFAEATVATGTSSAERSPLVVPASAPLFTGRRAVVYVEVPTENQGVAYEPRTVRLGPRLGDFYPVVAGLSEGQRVVMRGAFAVDADLQIRGGPSMMTRSDDAQQGEWDVVVELPRAQRNKLAPVVAAYLAVQEALADDALSAAQKGARQLAAAIASVELEGPRKTVAVWEKLATQLRGHAQHIVMASDLEGARTGFEPLSQGVQRLLERFGNPTDRPLRLAFCPMATGSDGASWVQRGTEIDNAYFGESMRTCGEVKQQLDPGAYLKPPSDPEAERRAPAAMGGGHAH